MSYLNNYKGLSTRWSVDDGQLEHECEEYYHSRATERQPRTRRGISLMPTHIGLAAAPDRRNNITKFKH